MCQYKCAYGGMTLSRYPEMNDLGNYLLGASDDFILKWLTKDERKDKAVYI
jgi:hypothetical protein